MKRWLLRSASLLWTEHKFNCDIPGLRKAEKMSITMLVMVVQTRQQPMKMLKQWRSDYSLLGTFLIMFGSCQAFFTDILWMKFGAAKIVPKLLNFEQNHRHMDIVQEMSTTYNDDSDLLKKVTTGGE